MNISDRIKVLAVRLGISVAELARRSGYSPSNFNQKMKRESFSINDLTEIAEKNGCKFEVAFVLDTGERI